MRSPKNIVGPVIRHLRNAKKLSQPKLAEALQRKGWSVTRDTIAKIEGQCRWLSDAEILFLARFFKVSANELFPHGHDAEKQLQAVLQRLERGLELFPSVKRSVLYLDTFLVTNRGSFGQQADIS